MKWKECRCCGRPYPEYRSGLFLDRCAGCRDCGIDDWTIGDTIFMVGVVVVLLAIAAGISWWVLVR